MMAERGENFKGDGGIWPLLSFSMNSMIVLEGPDIEGSGALRGNCLGHRENTGKGRVIRDFLQQGGLTQ